MRDQLEAVTGPDGAVTDPSYNLLGQKTQLIDPDMGTWYYAYDAAGNLVRQTDAKNQRICFYYDGHNRLKGKTYATGTADCPADPGYAGYTSKNYYDDTTYTYSEGSTTVTNQGLGRRTQMVDVSGSTQWVYDGRGRLRKETQTITGSGAFMTQWDYDAADRPVVQKYPGGNAGQAGEQVNFAYAPNMMLQSVSGTATYLGDTYYNALGQVTERRLGSATGVLRQLYAYTAAENFRLVSLKAGTAAPYTNRQNLSYTYDDVGNVLTISDAAAYNGTATPATQTQTFEYDHLDRLKKAQATGGGGALYGDYTQRYYAYSNAGNVTNFEGASLNLTNRYYLDANHKHALTHIDGTAASNQKYWYDDNGNATKRVTDATYDLSYDAENRLTQLKKNSAVSGTYVYDGDGNRVKETAGSSTTVYIGNTFEWTGSTATMKSYYYAGGTRVAMRIGTSTGAVNYLLGDHLGSQALTLTSAGDRLATNTELRYMPYGVARYTAGTTPTTFNFTGQRKDGGSGLLFYNARWYDPVVGRFLQADTLVPEPGDPQSLNRYSYVLNNPLRYTDPTGHCPQGDAGEACRQYLASVEKDYGVTIDDTTGLWTIEAMQGVALGLTNLQNAIAGDVYDMIVNGLEFFVQIDSSTTNQRNRMAHWGDGRISVGADVLADMVYIARNTVHEAAHHWDWLEKDGKSRGLMNLTGGLKPNFAMVEHDNRIVGNYVPGGEAPNSYAWWSAGEDWAESLTVSITDFNPKALGDPLRRDYAGVARGLWQPFQVIRHYGD